MSFAEIVQKTYCPFARSSRMGASVTVISRDVESELTACRDVIERFFEQAADNEHDGMIITFTDPSLGSTLAGLAALTRGFYQLLDELFVGVYLDDDPDPDQPWYAMIGGERFFLVSFAPCYALTSPRHTYGDTNTYFLLQPASTFVRNAAVIDRLRERIQHAFVAGGKPYDVVLANKENDMFKSVMPMSPSDSYVPWWLPEAVDADERTDDEMISSGDM
jgi:hypothetical protein